MLGVSCVIASYYPFSYSCVQKHSLGDTSYHTSKYLLRQLMSRLTTKQRNEVQAVVSSFNFSGISVKISTRICNHFRYFVGRDFKALAQCGLFVFRNYFTTGEQRVWLALSKVLCICFMAKHCFATIS